MPKVVFRYRSWMRFLFLFVFLILLVMVIWMGSMSVQMVSQLYDPFMMTLVIPSVFAFLVVLLALVVFGYVVLFYWTYRIEFGESHLRTWMIYHPFVQPFCCGYEDIARVRRGMVRGVLEIVPRTGAPLRLGIKQFEGKSDGLLDELSKRVGAECVEPDVQTRLWEYTRFDRFRLAFAIASFAVQGALLASFVGRDLVFATNPPHSVFEWVWAMTGIEVRSFLLLCGLIVVGVYVGVYIRQRRVWQSGNTQT